MGRPPSPAATLIRLVLIIASAANFSACITMILGSREAAEPDWIDLPLDSLSNLKQGTIIRLVLADSTVVVGTLSSHSEMDSAEYAARYGKFYDLVISRMVLPRIGDSVFLAQKNTRTPYIFRGLGNGTVRLQSADLKFWRSVAFERLLTTRMESVTGTPYDMEKLWRMSLKREPLPRNVLLNLQTEQGAVSVALDDVRFFHRKNPKLGTAGWVGIGLLEIGLIIGLGLLFVLLLLSQVSAK